jgi:hypothetical protein
MILASAALAGSLLGTGAQAQGGGNFGRGMGFGGGHVGGLGVGRVGGLGGDHVDGFGAGRMAHVDQGHLGVGRRHFVSRGIYDYDSFGCPYDTSYTPPYTCTY